MIEVSHLTKTYGRHLAVDDVSFAVEDGQICGQLSLASRYDVAQYVEKARGTAPLSLLTGGVHLHHLRCPDEAAYQRVCAALDKLGLLYTPEQQNRD